jgi:membrane protein YdbS with pleckstrin-like domain
MNENQEPDRGLPATDSAVAGSGAEPSASHDLDNDAGLTMLHPNHKKALRVQATIIAIPFVIGALFVEQAEILPKGLIVIPVALIALAAIIRLPARRHFARGYAMSADRLRVARGILFRSDTIVPFGRVQHIDVDQGPLERFFGIATLTLHTAGTHNSSVNLPGLEHSLAMDMRETIRSHIKRETV